MNNSMLVADYFCFFLAKCTFFLAPSLAVSFSKRSSFYYTYSFFQLFLFQISKTRVSEDHSLLIAKLEFLTGNCKGAWDIYKGVGLVPRPNATIRTKALLAEAPFIQGSSYLVTVFSKIPSNIFLGIYFILCDSILKFCSLFFDFFFIISKIHLITVYIFSILSHLP